MTTDTFIVILENKCTAFARTESGRIFDVTHCGQPITDSEYGINFNGVLNNAKQVPQEYVADLLTKGASIVFKKRKKKIKTKRRAASKTTTGKKLEKQEQEVIS